MDSEIGKSEISTTVEMKERSQLRSLTLPDSSLAVKIAQLVYTNSGDCILALTSNSIHKQWRWTKNFRNMDGMATTGIAPELWRPSGGLESMTNDLRGANLEATWVPACFSLSNNDEYLTSTSGGSISLFNVVTFEIQRISTFMPPPPPATSLAFFPPDNNFVAIGREDASILIYNIRTAEVIVTLNGHCKSVTALAFPLAADILLSLGEDGKLCLWGSEWELKASKLLGVTRECTTIPDHAESRLQFHRNQIHLLVFHKTMIAIYKASKLERVKESYWYPPRPAVTDATFSCTGHSIYVALDDGSVAVLFAPEMQIRCRIYPAAYIEPDASGWPVYPTVVAAHPSKPNQFAVGLTDGAVCVLEPLELTEENWGVACAKVLDGGAGPSGEST